MISILDHNRKDLIQSVKKRWKAQRVPHHRKFTWKSQWKFLFFSQLLALLSPTVVPGASVRLVTGGHSECLGTAATKSPSRRGFCCRFWCWSGQLVLFYREYLYHCRKEMITMNTLLSAKVFERCLMKPLLWRRFDGIFWLGNFTCRRPAASQLQFT